MGRTFFFLLWICAAFGVAWLANRSGRNGIVWFFLSLIISPVLTLIAVLLMADLSEPKRDEQVLIENRDDVLK